MDYFRYRKDGFNMANSNLNNAKKDPNDEFYTQYFVERSNQNEDNGSKD